MMICEMGKNGGDREMKMRKNILFLGEGRGEGKKEKCDWNFFSISRANLF